MLSTWFAEQAFRKIHRGNLVYNTCWEDPRLDREALQLTSDDHVMVITSAGCNALDYVLEGPRHVYAVDLNPLQNALLELKIACIRVLEYEEFWQLFGHGRCPAWNHWYQERVRRVLPTPARQVWDKRIDFFDGSSRRNSFYWRGSSGFFAWLVNVYINRVAKVRQVLLEMLEAESLEDQRDLFEKWSVRDAVWRPLIRWIVRRDTTLSLLGVPRQQRQQIDRSYRGGIEQFIIDRVEVVFTRLSLADNYFWRVYLTGAYTSTCCPHYLREDHFHQLRDGLIDRVTTHTASVFEFLALHQGPINKFVLLDHMDWLSGKHADELNAEWRQIVRHGGPRTRIIWRSAGSTCDFVNPITIQASPRESFRVGERLRYHHELAKSLHVRDRVQTYGSFYIADLAAN